MADRLGVGILGCGAAAQAIHLPALASLPELFGVVHCADPDAELAARVAGRVGARSSADPAAPLDDADVDVVVVCSPDRFHAEQVVAACHAGKRAVLCEKPLADTMDGTRAVVQASAETGVPVIVATMHRYDPALRALERRWDDLPSRARLIRSTIQVMPNADLVALATEPVAASAGAVAPSAQPSGQAPPIELLMFRGLMLGLFIHHAPLVRLALPHPESVDVALPLGASGYEASLRSDGRIAQLSGFLHRIPRVSWTFEMWSPDAYAGVVFPPGYVPTKSASARLVRSANGIVHEERFGDAHETGYRAEWRHVAAVARGEAEPLTPALEGSEDVAFALRVAEEADRRWEPR